MKFLMRRIIGIVGNRERFAFAVIEASSHEEALTRVRDDDFVWQNAGTMSIIAPRSFIEITAEEVKPHEAG